jgi:hypothetical protein
MGALALTPCKKVLEAAQWRTIRHFIKESPNNGNRSFTGPDVYIGCSGPFLWCFLRLRLSGPWTIRVGSGTHSPQQGRSPLPWSPFWRPLERANRFNAAWDYTQACAGIVSRRPPEDRSRMVAGREYNKSRDPGRVRAGTGRSRIEPLWARVEIFRRLTR